MNHVPSVAATLRTVSLSHVPIDDELKDAVLRALSSGRYILGPECQALEAELAAYVGRKHCVLSSSWTAAVILLNYALDLAPGDEVLVPSLTAFPTVEPLIHHGAVPVFVDVDRYGCMDPAAAAAAVTPRTKGIIPVHLYGHPADMDPLLDLAAKNNLWLLEDCAQAHGARHSGRMVGSMGVAGAFSFYPSKNLSAFGDGGCIVTDDDRAAALVRSLRDHGRMSKYEHDRVGYNLRFNDLQAAAARVGLRHLDRRNAHRRAIAARYAERLAGLVELPPVAPWAEPVYHMFVIRHPDRDALADHLQTHGVGTGIHYPKPCHVQPAIVDRFGVQPTLPATEKMVDEILSLPIYGDLALDDVDYVCDRVTEFLG